MVACIPVVYITLGVVIPAGHFSPATFVLSLSESALPLADSRLCLVLAPMSVAMIIIVNKIQYLVTERCIHNYIYVTKYYTKFPSFFNFVLS